MSIYIVLFNYIFIDHFYQIKFTFSIVVKLARGVDLKTTAIGIGSRAPRRFGIDAISSGSANGNASDEQPQQEGLEDGAETPEPCHWADQTSYPMLATKHCEMAGSI